MTTVIHSLTNLTAHRNRELLDVALAHAIMEVVVPQTIVFATLVEQDGQRRWLERARFDVGQPPRLVDPMWARFESLPERSAFPDRLGCIESAVVQESAPADGSGQFVTVFPVHGETEVDSVLEVYSAHALDTREMDVVNCMQSVYRNMQSLLDYSERDSLTGLLNRKSFDDAFFKAMGAQRSGGERPEAGEPDVARDRRLATVGHGYWLGMLDIDHFKRVNDGFGHLIGDEVLLLVARLLRHGFRFHDRLYRFGGEEFVVLMRCADAEQAQAVFGRFRCSMEAFAFPQVGTITVSVGITQLLPSDTPTQALDRADQAVYAAKSGGRNRVIDHADLVRQGRAKAEVKAGDIELF